jgi:hypothetical protein
LESPIIWFFRSASSICTLNFSLQTII